MKIFLNLPALIIVVSFYCIVYLLGFISPDFGDLTHPFFWIVFCVISGFAEMIKLRGRIFYLPMWIIGFAGLIISSNHEYSEYGLLIGFALSLGIFSLGFLLVRFNNKKRFSKCEIALNELKLMQSKVISIRSLSLMKSSFYIPNYMNSDNFIQYVLVEKMFDMGLNGIFYKKEINKHYLDFLEIFKQYITEDEYKQYVVVFHNSLKKIGSSKKVYIEQYMFENIDLLMKSKGKQLKQN